MVFYGQIVNMLTTEKLKDGEAVIMKILVALNPRECFNFFGSNNLSCWDIRGRINNYNSCKKKILSSIATLHAREQLEYFVQRTDHTNRCIIGDAAPS